MMLTWEISPLLKRSMYSLASFWTAS